MSRKRFKLVPEMEGWMARWYARSARVLEIAPGPGYLAIEIARLGRFEVTGLDVSRTFVEIGRENARKAGVTVDFRHGDAAAVPFEANSFDLVVCQAAFKNFTEPVCALDEMHRVLRPGGSAIIQDLSKDAANADIDREVIAMKLSRFNTLATRFMLETILRRRAYTPAQFERLVAESAFRACDIRKDGIGLEVRLKRSSLEKAA